MMRPATHLRFLAAVLAAGLTAAGPAIPAGADPAMHCVVGFKDYALESPDVNPFYTSVEDDSVAAFIVKIREVDCPDSSDPWVAYETQNGSAVASTDFQGVSGAVQLEDGGAAIPVTLLNNGEPPEEPVVESFELVLTGGKSGWSRSPSRGLMYIIDDDGATPRAAFRPLPSFSQVENKTSVKIAVFMGGEIASPINVGYVVGGTATAGDDYTSPASTLTFTDADRVEVIQFTLNNDSTPEPDETVVLNLTDGADYDVGSPGSLTLTIFDDDADTTKPRSWFHHPRHGKTYPYGDYRLREMHVFFDDGPRGSGVVAVDMALRRKKLSGKCTWYVGGRTWTAGRCDSKRWVPMTFDFDLYLRRFTPPLPPSTGTTIKNYTAWCRATDAAGNVQTAFVKSFLQGSNNTFEVGRR